MAIGALGYMAIGIESAQAGAAAGTTTHSANVIDYVPFTSEAFTVVRDDIPDPGISASWDEDAIFNGLQRVEGNLTLLAHPVQMGYFLRTAFDTFSSFPGSSGGAVFGITGTTSHAGVRVHHFTTGTQQYQTGSGTDLPANTFVVFRTPAGVGSAFAYYNMCANNYEVTIDAGQMMRQSIDYLGRDHGRVARATPTFPPAVAIPWSTSSVQVGGLPIRYFESLTFRIENNMEAIAALDGRTKPDKIKRTISAGYS